MGSLPYHLQLIFLEVFGPKTDAVSIVILCILSESLSLLGEELVMVSHPGVQRDILSQLELCGPSALVYPTKLFHHCIAIGLKPVYTEVNTPLNCPLVSYIEVSDRWCILTCLCRSSNRGMTHGWFFNLECL